MSIKCDLCGAHYSENEERCPECGAKNPNFKRIVVDKPKTINELKAWYVSKNLPPYETTRFFIGINYTKPRAFGIYEDGEKFVVYKNKNDGSRVIRYEGIDEEYAVNELYLRLKQEIKNQKSHQKRRLSLKKTTFITLTAVFSTIALIVVLIIYLESGVSERRVETAIKPYTSQYYYDDGSIFYCDYGDSYNSFTWWKYNEDLDDYVVYLTTKVWDKEHPIIYFPINVDNNDCHTYSINGIYDMLYPDGHNLLDFYDKYNIYNSHNYIDAGHHFEPAGERYYTVGDKQYYYLPNRYSRHGQNYSGWYAYEDYYWAFYCNYDDRDMLGDELWYDSDKYYTSYNYENTGLEEQGIAPFEDSLYYQDFLEARESWSNEYEERESDSFWSFFDSDSDW